MAPREPALVVSELEKWWDPTSGLRPVSFTVDPGELVVVRGRGGSGKSTLLAVIAGWCPPDKGSVRVAGTPAASEEWARIAVVPQVLALVPELTAREHVAIGCGWLPRAEHEARVAQALDTLQLEELASRAPSDMSMGQQQRVAVARAVVAHPLVLLADEPTSHQDPGHEAAVLAAMQAAARAGSAVLVATHAEEVVAAADRVIDLAT